MEIIAANISMDVKSDLGSCICQLSEPNCKNLAGVP